MRSLAALVLGVALFAPAARLVCAITCQPVPVAAATSHCHEAPASEPDGRPAFQAAQLCLEDAIAAPDARIESRAGLAPLALTVEASDRGLMVLTIARAEHRRVVDTSPPALLVPLRI